MDTYELTIYDFIDELKNDIYKAYLNKKLNFGQYRSFTQECDEIALIYKDLKNAIN